ncbi:hypothetical protein CY35_19G056400 [Sphagnum magellanicum]|nr:hypothetical protein CY35_19G056400 [Sphagnum magellanicum]
MRAPQLDEDGVEVQKLEGSEERIGEGEEPVADAQGTEAIVINQKVKGKKQQQQQHHQRQQTEPKKPRKEHEIEQKQVGLNTGKDSTAQGEAAGGRMQRCKQPVVQTTLAWRATQQPPQSQPQPMPQSQSELPQPLAHRRQRRMPRTFSIPIEELEGGLRSLTRNHSSNPVLASTAVVPTTGAKGATKRSKRVAQRLANEEPAPPPLKLPKLHLVLTRKEIQEDWVKITGHKYSGKPKKSTLIQRGLGLCTALTCPSSIRYLNEPQSLQVP